MVSNLGFGNLGLGDFEDRDLRAYYTNENAAVKSHQLTLYSKPTHKVDRILAVQWLMTTNQLISPCGQNL